MNLHVEENQAINFQIVEIDKFLNEPLITPDERRAAEMQRADLMTIRQDKITAIAMQEEHFREIRRDNRNLPPIMINVETFLQQIRPTLLVNTTSINTSNTTLLDQEEDAQEEQSIESLDMSRMISSLKNIEISSENDHVEAVESDGIMGLQKRKTSERCASCLEKKNVYERFPCGHTYCGVCLQNLFENGIKDISLLPIKCCKQEVDQTLVNKLFTDQNKIVKLNSLVEEKRALGRIYCPNKICSKPIETTPPSPASLWTSSTSNISSERILQCRFCSTSICNECHNFSHSGVTCQRVSEMEQMGDETFYQYMKDSKLSRCNNCRRYIEMVHGCNHMTCICGHHFCYLCGVKWRECRCELFTEHHLLNAGRDRAGDQRDNIVEVRNHMRRIAREEMCAIHVWKRIEVGGGIQCQCGFKMWVYHFQCRNCQMQVCNTCRYHRIG